MMDGGRSAADSEDGDLAQLAFRDQNREAA